MSSANLILVMPAEQEEEISVRLKEVAEFALYGYTADIVYTTEKMKEVLGQESAPRFILFALSLGEAGINLEYFRMIRYLREAKEALSGCIGGVIVDGESHLYTKSTAAELVFTANCAGCSFVGRPLVEGTVDLGNFSVISRNMGTDLLTAYKRSAAQLVESVLKFRQYRYEKPNLLVLHASIHETSNTLAIWNKVKEKLPEFQITEIGLRSGTLADCAGCPYKMCLHYGEQGTCFYGGIMVEEVYPAVKNANAVLMLCPNYNDAISANLTAFINRLTALFRASRFNDKALFSIVVSGYSGSDVVARQLIAALNMNKAFYLPKHFAMLETANDVGAALKLPGVDERIETFAQGMRVILRK